MDNRKKNNLKFWTIIILLIIIILLLLFFVKFGKIHNDYMLIPTGNVDVFDIDINCDCSGKEDDNCNKTDKDGNILPVYKPEIDKNTIGQVWIDDKNGNYIYQQNLKIFTNSAFYYTEKIAPGISNTYNFVVHNSTPVKLKYNIQMNEDSEYKINLKYRLKREGNYIIGNESTWVSADELITGFYDIDTMHSDKYALDWKWAYDDGVDSQDTIAGEYMTSTYKLNIRFYFEEIEE